MAKGTRRLRVARKLWPMLIHTTKHFMVHALVRSLPPDDNNRVRPTDSKYQARHKVNFFRFSEVVHRGPYDTIHRVIFTTKAIDTYDAVRIVDKLEQLWPMHMMAEEYPAEARKKRIQHAERKWKRARLGQKLAVPS